MAEVLFFQGGELVFHIVFEEDGHIAVIECLGKDLIGDTVVIEIIDPEFDGVGRIGSEIEVLADVAQDQIGPSVAVEIGHGEGLPPAEEVIEIGGQLGEMVAGELEDAWGHPVAGEDELVLTIAIEAGPAGGGDHADMGDIGIAGRGDIGEMAVAVVEVDKAGGVGTVFAGYGASADEQIGEAVVIEIAGDGYGGVDAIGMGGYGVGGEGEMAVTVIEEEAVLHLPGIGGMVIAAGADEEIGEAVVVGIEEQDGLVFEIGELVEGGLSGFDEASGRVLEIELAGVTGGAADKDIGEAVAVDIGGGGFGAFPGKQFGKITFVEEIDIVVFLVFVEGGVDVAQQGSDGFGWRRSGSGFLSRLADGMEGIDSGVIEAGDRAVGPGDGHGIGVGNGAQTDDLFVIDGGLEAPAGNEFAIEDLWAAEDADLAADGEGIGGEAMEHDGQVVVVIELAGVVAIEEGGAVLVVDDQVEIAVVVQIAIGGAIGEGGMGEAPLDADVPEAQIAQVAEDLVQQRLSGHLIEQIV